MLGKVDKMRVNDFRSNDIANYQGIKTNRAKTEAAKAEGISQDSTAVSRNGSFINDVKAINESVMGIELAGSSMQKISGDKMESAMADLRNITNSLKEMLNKSFSSVENKSATYTDSEIKERLTNSAFASSHNYDYLADKAAALLA